MNEVETIDLCSDSEEDSREEKQQCSEKQCGDEDEGVCQQPLLSQSAELRSSSDDSDEADMVLEESEEEKEQASKVTKDDFPLVVSKFITACDATYARLLKALTLLQKCVANIQTHPSETKYRTFGLDNESFIDKLGSVTGAVSVLLALGFKHAVDDSSGSNHDSLAGKSASSDAAGPGSKQGRRILFMSEEAAQEQDFLQVCLFVLNSAVAEVQSPQWHKSYEAKLQELRVRARLRGESCPVVVDGGRGKAPRISRGRETDFQKVLLAKKQLKKVRLEKADAYRRTRKRKMFTLDDLEQKLLQEASIRGVDDSEIRLGKEALDHTNEFRRSQGLGPLQWSRALHDAGFSHSKGMALGDVPFDHIGFQDRCRSFPFSYRSAGENLAWNQNCGDTARVAVNGWIKSPGHRKNLLGNYNYCGISVFKGPNGRTYFTQLLALV